MVKARCDPCYQGRKLAVTQYSGRGKCWVVRFYDDITRRYKEGGAEELCQEDQLTCEDSEGWTDYLDEL